MAEYATSQDVDRYYWGGKYGGKGDQYEEEPPKQGGGWTQRLISAAKWAGILTAVGGTTATLVIGGGIALLLASPVLIFTAPLWIPVVLFLLVAGGVILATLVGLWLTYLAISWLWQYVRDEHPPGASKVDWTAEKVSETLTKAKDTTVGYGEKVFGAPRSHGQAGGGGGSSFS